MIFARYIANSLFLIKKRSSSYVMCCNAGNVLCPRLLTEDVISYFRLHRMKFTVTMTKAVRHGGTRRINEMESKVYP